MPSKDKEARLASQRSHYARNREKVRAAVNARRKNKRQEWHEYKKTLSCIKCGFNHPAALDFHHIVKHPDNKKIFSLLSQGARTQLWEELKKCVVLCANCHRIHHHDERAAEKKAKKKLKAP